MAYYKFIAKVLPMLVNQSVTYVSELYREAPLCDLCASVVNPDLSYFNHFLYILTTESQEDTECAITNIGNT